MPLISLEGRDFRVAAVLGDKLRAERPSETQVGSTEEISC